MLESAAALKWYAEQGLDETIGEDAVDRFSLTQAVAAATAPVAMTPRAATPQPIRPGAPAPINRAPVPLESPQLVEDARELARRCNTLAELEAAVRGFEGCALKRTAKNTVFADGTSGAPVMIVGEAPGADEDRLGKPFVGVSGQLMDRMMEAIGLTRAGGFYITNILFWRPPGNRQPTPQEIQQCLPFVVRHIELVRPAVLVLLGGTSAKTILNQTEGIMRLRGRWFEYRSDESLPVIPALPTYHPAYLLRSPGQKREAWRDFLALKLRMSDPL